MYRITNINKMIKKGVFIKMKKLLVRIFPPNLNNDYKGYKISLYVFYALTALVLWRSQHHVLAPDGGAQSIATIPLDTFTEFGATAVISAFSLWGLSQLILGFINVLVVLRYKSLLPFMYILMIFEYLGRMMIGSVKPMPQVGTAPGGVINLPFVILALVMLVLSLKEPSKKD